MTKAMYKCELAELAGVSRSTFSRFLASKREELARMGVGAKTKLLPPRAVKYLAEEYCIELPP